MADNQNNKNVIFNRGAQAAALFVCVVALSVLAGWLFNIPVLKSLLPTWISMKANTALCFLLCGMALYTAASPSRRQIARASMVGCMFLTLLLAAATLLQYVLNRNFGIDEALFDDPSVGTPTLHPGRMAPATSVNFILLSIALIILNTWRTVWAVTSLAAAVFIITFFALSHYLYNVTSFFGIPGYTQMAFHTIVLFMALSAGLVAARSDRGFMKLWFSGGVSGMIMRRVLPPAVLFPPFFGWLRWQGQRANLYDTEFGLALTTLFSTIAIAGVVVLTAHLAHKVEQQRELIKQQLENAMERLNLALSTAGVGTWHWDFATNQFVWDDHVPALFGLPPGTDLGDIKAFLSHINIEDVERVVEAMEHARAEHADFSPEFKVAWSDGSVHILATKSKAFRQNGSEGLTGVFWDVTERKRVEEQLRFEAYNDPLTRLPNRIAFVQHLDRALAHEHRRGSYRFAVLFLDLDRFKHINDTFGHSVGDQLLVQVGERLSSLLRPGDIASRFGGDEFTVLLDDLNNKSDGGDAARVAKKLQQELQKPFVISGQTVYIDSSIGLAHSQTGYKDSETLLRDADVAMYRAKHLGKGRVEVFDKSLHEQVARTLTIETEMRSGLDGDEFYLHYQPIVALDSQKLIGFEALVRWNNPLRGAMSPADFIPVAEESGLIGRLGWLVLEEACRAKSRWTAAGISCTISINVSSRQFLQQGFCDRVAGILASTRVPGEEVKMEITESLTMHTSPEHGTVIPGLKELGIGVQIDDFGTGYSSLSYLGELPIDALKIDRSFVRQLGTERGDELCRTVITLAANMGMECIAEGIETAEQLQKLMGMGCKLGQGYLFAKPLSETDAMTYARNSPPATPAYAI